jgi:hypothetical protein
VAYDSFGNRQIVGGDSFEILLTDNLDGSNSNSKNKNAVIYLEDFKNGTYQVIYRLKKSGEYLLEISLNNMQIRNSPFLIRCKWGMNAQYDTTT